MKASGGKVVSWGLRGELVSTGLMVLNCQNVRTGRVNAISSIHTCAREKDCYLCAAASPRGPVSSQIPTRASSGVVESTFSEQITHTHI